MFPSMSDDAMELNKLVTAVCIKLELLDPGLIVSVRRRLRSRSGTGRRSERRSPPCRRLRRIIKPA